MVTPAASNALHVEIADTKRSTVKLKAVYGGENHFQDNAISFYPFPVPDNDPEWSKKLAQPRGRAKTHEKGVQLR